MSRSDKELAFLFDQFVAPDWGERFAELFDDNIKLPKRGSILYAGAGTGSHALKILDRAGTDFVLTCVEESAEQLELARAKAAALQMLERTEFVQSQLESLQSKDDQFDFVISNASLVAPERIPEVLAEMVRAAVPGATVAFSIVTSSSFGEFFSIYWEALFSAGLEDYASNVETLIKALPIASDMEALAAREGLDKVKSATRKEEFIYESGEDFLRAPLVTDFLLKDWMEMLPGEETRGRVSQEIKRIIDEERLDGAFSLSVKATVIWGQKAER